MRYTPLATDALCPMPARAPHVTEKGYISDFNRRVYSRVFNADLLSISHFSFQRWRNHQSKSTLKKLSAFNVSLVRGCYFEQTKRFCREQFFGISLHLFLLTLAMRSIAPITDICVVKSQSKETFILQPIFSNPVFTEFQPRVTRGRGVCIRF